jgi:aspartate aminotransferase
MMRREFEERRNLVCRRLNALRGITCNMPQGAFYAFFNIRKHFGAKLGGTTIANSADFCQAALEQAHVNLVPGSAFGAEDFVRLSYAASIDILNGGLDELDKWLIAH